MALPIKYNVRNVFVRWRATMASVSGVALIVWVYVVVQSLAVGLEKSSGNTGDPRNVMIVRKGSTAESSSIVTREQFRLMLYWPEIARDAEGRPLVSADVIVLVSLPRRPPQPHASWYVQLWRRAAELSGSKEGVAKARDQGSGEANVLVRGLSASGKELRPQVALVAGRWFAPGKREVVVSRRLAARFANFEIGDRFLTAGQWLTVVGWMDGRASAFDSEIWMDVDQTREIFDREYYSSVLARVSDDAAAKSLEAKVESDKRLPLRAIGETDYYAAQTMTAVPIRILGDLLATAMSVGAVFAAMNTMYASVGARTREIGTLRVLGFRRRTILASFILEGAILALAGGAVGCLVSLGWNGISTGTMSFETFSEVVFNFRVTPWLLGKGLIFSVTVGVLGSFLPALRASRLPVIAALRSV